jgi:MFS family permease
VGTWLPQIMRQAGYPPGSAIAFLLVLNLGNVIGTLVIATVADRIGSKRVIPIALGVGTASLVLLSFLLPQAVLYVLVALLGFGAMGSQILVNGFVAASYPTRIRATGLGFAMGVGRLGGILGPYAVGLLIGAGVGFRGTSGSSPPSRWSRCCWCWPWARTPTSGSGRPGRSRPTGRRAEVGLHLGAARRTPRRRRHGARPGALTGPSAQLPTSSPWRTTAHTTSADRTRMRTAPTG